MSNMSKDEIKQAIEGFTQFMREMWNNPNLTVPKDLAEKYDISSEFRGMESEDKCKKCEYYINPDYIRCHTCKVESEEE